MHAHDKPGASLAEATLVVWAVKPQTFHDAALQAGPHNPNALHLSVAAGIRSDSIAGWLGTERVVRAMPNTPALIDQGVTALFARSGVTAADRRVIDQLVQTTGSHLWLDAEAQLDAVTALSGSGPAYVFYFIEAMVQAGVEMGQSPQQAHQLAVGTFAGAAALAQGSEEAPATLRARVTSKGGTTHAARQRARELGDEFGAG